MSIQKEIEKIKRLQVSTHGENVEQIPIFDIDRQREAADRVRGKDIARAAIRSVMDFVSDRRIFFKGEMPDKGYKADIWYAQFVDPYPIGNFSSGLEIEMGRILYEVNGVFSRESVLVKLGNGSWCVIEGKDSIQIDAHETKRAEKLDEGIARAIMNPKVDTDLVLWKVFTKNPLVRPLPDSRKR